MLPVYKKKANIAAAIWFVSLIALGGILGSIDGNIWDDPNWPAILIFSVHGISFIAALWYYAEAKGYSGFIGLGLAFLYALGLIILLVLKDKHEDGESAGEKPTSTPSKHWKAYLAVLCVILVGGVIGFGKTYEDAAFYVGYYLFPSIVVAVIAYAIFGNGGGKPVGTSIFVAVYASLIIGSLISREVQQQEAVEGIEYFLDQADALVDAQYATDDQGNLLPIDQNFAPSADVTGSMAVMQQFMSDLLNRGASLTNDYYSELEAIGWVTILDGTRLQADTNFDDSRRLLKNARSIAEKYRALAVELVVGSGDRIQDLNLPAAEKREFEEGYKRGVANASSKLEEIWTLEMATLNEFENLITMLADDPQSWTVEEGQILFTTQEQLDRYNGYLATINLLAEEQLRLQKANIEAQREKLDDF